MGFSVKVAPGVRIRASSRGVRTSIGPRAARVHVGGGRTGVSTGVGPVSVYTSLSGSRRAPTNRSTSAGASQRALAEAAKAQEAEQLRAALDRILNLHRQSFTPYERVIAPEPPSVDVAAVHRWHRQQALAGLGVLQRSARRVAKQQAAVVAAADVENLQRARLEDRARRQAELDQVWAALLANDEQTVLWLVADAFEDNEAPSAPIGVSGSELSVVVLVPDIDIVPERRPTFTAAGNLSLKKLTKAERSGLHTILVASHVLLTVREALAVAPRIDTVRVVALHQARVDAFGVPRIDVLLAASFDRHQLDAVRWDQADANVIVQDAARELVVNLKRTTNQLLPIATENEPALQELLKRVEIDDLLGRPTR